MSEDDWSDIGVAAAAEYAAVWRDEFIRHKRNGEDLAWAEHFADMKAERFLRKVERIAKQETGR